MQNVSYNKSVFVNFPFDPPGSKYDELFKALIFTVKDCGFEPRCALEREDGGEERLNKIIEIIKNSKFSIHDISCIEDCNGLPRFNMPFELGLFVGAKKFGKKEKTCLIFEKTRHKYDKYFSESKQNEINRRNPKLVYIIRGSDDSIKRNDT